MNREIEKCVPTPRDPSIMSSATAHVFEWGKKNYHADNQGVGAEEAAAQSQVKGSKRKSPDKCNIGNYLEESTPESSENLCIVPESDVGRASPSFSKLSNVNLICNDEHDSARECVIATLNLYRDLWRELFQKKSTAGGESMSIRRLDFHAAKEVKKRVGYVHGAMQFIGDVPGVEVGDKFYYRMELAVVGVHRPPQGGIDYMGRPPHILATSVVASWEYRDNLTNPDELVYLGQGGTFGRGKKDEDQRLTKGNLALANSMEKKKPVRVIRKDKFHAFTYDGLYVVNSCREIYATNGKIAFEFVMNRLSGVDT